MSLRNESSNNTQQQPQQQQQRSHKVTILNSGKILISSNNNCPNQTGGGQSVTTSTITPTSTTTTTTTAESPATKTSLTHTFIENSYITAVRKTNVSSNGDELKGDVQPQQPQQPQQAQNLPNTKKIIVKTSNGTKTYCFTAAQYQEFLSCSNLISSQSPSPARNIYLTTASPTKHLVTVATPVATGTITSTETTATNEKESENVKSSGMKINGNDLPRVITVSNTTSVSSGTSTIPEAVAEAEKGAETTTAVAEVAEDAGTTENIVMTQMNKFHDQIDEIKQMIKQNLNWQNGTGYIEGSTLRFSEDGTGLIHLESESVKEYFESGTKSSTSAKNVARQPEKSDGDNNTVVAMTANNNANGDGDNGENKEEKTELETKVTETVTTTTATASATATTTTTAKNSIKSYSVCKTCSFLGERKLFFCSEFCTKKCYVAWGDQNGVEVIATGDGATGNEDDGEEDKKDEQISSADGLETTTVASAAANRKKNKSKSNKKPDLNNTLPLRYTRQTCKLNHPFSFDYSHGKKGSKKSKNANSEDDGFTSDLVEEIEEEENDENSDSFDPMNSDSDDSAEMEEWWSRLKDEREITIVAKKENGRRIYPWQGGRNGGFVWSRYLTLIRGRAAPSKLFTRPFECTRHGFAIGMMLETIDPIFPSRFRVATITHIIGIRLCLHMFSFHKSTDFWVNADAWSIFPAGFCSKTNRHTLLVNEYKKCFNWNEHMKKNRVTLAPAYLFNSTNKPTKESKGFCVGMKLELISRENNQHVYVSTIMDHIGSRFLVHVDESNEEHDMWLEATSPYIRPINWHETVGCTLIPPRSFKILNAKFNWERYLRDTSSIAVHKHSFRPRPEIGFRKGMHLEAVDPRVPQLIRCATVDRVDGYQLKIRFDGWPPEYDFWADDDHPDLHPIDWCAKTRHTLEPPLTSDFNETGPCNVHGCKGIGSAGTLGVSSHSTLKACPYSANNIQRRPFVNHAIRLHNEGFFEENTMNRSKVVPLKPIATTTTTTTTTSSSLGNDKETVSVTSSSSVPITESSVTITATTTIDSESLTVSAGAVVESLVETVSVDTTMATTGATTTMTTATETVMSTAVASSSSNVEELSCPERMESSPVREASPTYVHDRYSRSPTVTISDDDDNNVNKQQAPTENIKSELNEPGQNSNEEQPEQQPLTVEMLNQFQRIDSRRKNAAAEEQLMHQQLQQRINHALQKQLQTNQQLQQQVQEQGPNLGMTMTMTMTSNQTVQKKNNKKKASGTASAAKKLKLSQTTTTPSNPSPYATNTWTAQMQQPPQSVSLPLQKVIDNAINSQLRPVPNVTMLPQQQQQPQINHTVLQWQQQNFLRANQASPSSSLSAQNIQTDQQSVLAPPPPPLPTTTQTYLPPLHKKLDQWTPVDVAAFVESISNCHEYARQFFEQQIDGETLAIMTRNDFMEGMNIKLGPAIKLMNRIRTLRDSLPK